MLKEVYPVKSLHGRIELPPDKSISHRAAMFAALSDYKSVIRNYSLAADPQSTLHCLKDLGVQISTEKKGKVVHISGVGRDGLKVPDKPLDCGNSGTTMRLLSGILAGAGIPCTLIGDKSLSSRTMKRIIDPLRSMGCNISAMDEEFAPLTIEKHNGIKGIHYPLPIASAQLKSSVLLAGLYGVDKTEVLEYKMSRDHTERLLGLSTRVTDEGSLIESSRNHVIPIQSYEIPGDFSAAAFWLVAGLIHEKSEITLQNVGMNPSRTAALKILEEMGARFKVTPDNESIKEPKSEIVIEPADLIGIHLDPNLVPNCIDELPVLMVAMCYAKGTSVISGAEELRHKETDRLSAMGEILEKAGARFELKPDGILIHGDPGFIPAPAEYPSRHDHRMAMASAIMATKSDRSSFIQDAECTSISYPEFWDHLVTLSQ